MLNCRHVVLFSTVCFLTVTNKMQLLVKIQGAIVDTPVFQVIIQDAIKSIKQKAVLPNSRHVSLGFEYNELEEALKW